MESLRRHRQLLLDERMTACIMEIQTTRSEMAQQFQSLSTDADTRFSSLLRETETVYQQLSTKLYESGEKDAEREAQRQQESLMAIKSSIAGKLDTPDHEADHQQTLGKRFAQSGQGLLQDQRFLDWYQGRDRTGCILYLHGKPGAGTS